MKERRNSSVARSQNSGRTRRKKTIASRAHCDQQRNFNHNTLCRKSCKIRGNMHEFRTFNEVPANMDIPMSSQLGDSGIVVTDGSVESSSPGSTSRDDYPSSGACLHVRPRKNHRRELDYDSDESCQCTPLKLARQTSDPTTPMTGVSATKSVGFLTPISKGGAANNKLLSCPRAPLKQTGCREFVEISTRVRRRLEF